MNANTTSNKFLSFIAAASALALPIALAASPFGHAVVLAVSAMDDVETVVTGKVEAKGSASLTVDGRTVLVNDATTYTRDGAAAALADIRPGDEVRVTATKDSGGTLVASKVEVTKSAT